MEFLTQNNPPEYGEGKTGNGLREIIKQKKLENGQYIYEKVGESNIYEKIQANLENTLIYNLLDKYKNGDIFALNKKPANEYGDISNIPNNTNDLHKMTENAGKKYQQLPQILKDKILNGGEITQEDIINAYQIKIPETETQKPEEKKE